MKKLIIAGAAFIGIGAVVKLFAPKFGDVDWETRFARMPDNAPRKWMFRNIAEIRHNTEHIIELLEARSSVMSSGPVEDGPPEIIDAARQETEYPADETNEA
ncbi:MAG: hypothetical protein ACHQDE_10135 [Acidimicrobiia bacterium]